MQQLVNELQKEVRLLEKWADESVNGGWSTHQVEAMRKRAAEIKAILFDLAF